MQRTNTTDATTDAETLAKVFKRASRFVGRERAFSYAATTAKPSRVMLGDDGRFWVVTPADANRLERMGYEYAN